MWLDRRYWRRWENRGNGRQGLGIPGPRRPPAPPLLSLNLSPYIHKGAREGPMGPLRGWPC